MPFNDFSRKKHDMDIDTMDIDTIFRKIAVLCHKDHYFGKF